MVDALKVLQKEPGIRTAAVTNNFIMDGSTDFAGTQEIQPLFDTLVESALVRVRKPDPAIYRLACERLGVEPARCIFLDDIGRNLKPAQAMGMQTIKCALDDTSGARALGKLATLLGGDVGRKLQAAPTREALTDAHHQTPRTETVQMWPPRGLCCAGVRVWRPWSQSRLSYEDLLIDELRWCMPKRSPSLFPLPVRPSL